MIKEHDRFERLIRPYQYDLQRNAYFLTRNKADAEDLVQETLLRAYERIDQITNLASIRGWLCAVQRNISRNRYRHEARFLCRCRSLDSDASLGLQPASSGTESEFMGKLERERLMAALERLPAEFREPLLRFGFDGQSYQEVALQLNLPIGTIRSRISRGRKRLRRALSGDGLVLLQVER